MSFDGGTARTLARCLAWGRLGLGVSALLAPTVPLRPWVGPDADRPTAKLLARALGGRDVALGLGAVLALRHEAPARGWLEAGGLADGADVLGTLLAFRALPRRGRWLVLAAAAGGVAASRALVPAVD